MNHPVRTRAVLAFLSFSAVSVSATRAPAASGDFQDHEDLTEEVLSCEDAVAELAACCGVDPHSVACVDYAYRETSSCSGHVEEGHIHPWLQIGESECVRDLSCDELLASGTCAAAVSRARGETPSEPRGCL